MARQLRDTGGQGRQDREERRRADALGYGLSQLALTIKVAAVADVRTILAQRHREALRKLREEGTEARFAMHVLVRIEVRRGPAHQLAKPVELALDFMGDSRGIVQRRHFVQRNPLAVAA